MSIGKVKSEELPVKDDDSNVRERLLRTIHFCESHKELSIIDLKQKVKDNLSNTCLNYVMLARLPDKVLKFLKNMLLNGDRLIPTGTESIMQLSFLCKHDEDETLLLLKQLADQEIDQMFFSKALKSRYYVRDIRKVELSSAAIARRKLRNKKNHGMHVVRPFWPNHYEEVSTISSEAAEGAICLFYNADFENQKHIAAVVRSAASLIFNIEVDYDIERYRYIFSSRFCFVETLNFKRAIITHKTGGAQDPMQRSRVLIVCGFPFGLTHLRDTVTSFISFLSEQTGIQKVVSFQEHTPISQHFLPKI